MMATHAYMGGVIRTEGCEAIKIGGYIDHVHLLVSLGRTMTVADVVKETKRVTTHWLQTEKGHPHFKWQAGYGAFSVGRREETTLVSYIDRQAEHHRTVSFKEEYMKLLTNAGVEFDERYLWD